MPSVSTAVPRPPGRVCAVATGGLLTAAEFLALRIKALRPGECHAGCRPLLPRHFLSVIGPAKGKLPLLTESLTMFWQVRWIEPA